MLDAAVQALAAVQVPQERADGVAGVGEQLLVGAGADACQPVGDGRTVDSGFGASGLTGACRLVRVVGDLLGCPCLRGSDEDVAAAVADGVAARLALAGDERL